MYYIYMLRCEDGSIYTGITPDLKNRFLLHQAGKGAKYTKSHKAVRIEACFVCDDKSKASKLEYRLKHLKKSDKELLILRKMKFCDISDKIRKEDYKRLNKKEILLLIK